MRLFRVMLRALRREDGISLVMAVGVLAVLSTTGATVIYTANTNARSAEYSLDNGSAYALAESGINEMVAILAKPQNNALTPTLLPQTTRTYSTGTLTWVGTLDLASATWALTSTAKVKNPTGASNDVTRVLKAKVPITPTYTQPLNNPAWDYIYATRTGNECDMTLANNVLGSARLYVEGNFCLRNNSKISISSLIVKGNMDLSNNTAVGSTSERVETYVGAGCKYGTQIPWSNWATPCSGDQDGRKIFAKRWLDGAWVTGVNPTTPVIARPTADHVAWYERAVPGPLTNCTAANGARTGTPPTFDNDTIYNNSLAAVQDLTPASSYTCRVGSAASPAGEIEWNATSRVLKVRGTFFIDGSAKIDNGLLNQYDGQGTIYLAGSLYLNGKMCGSAVGGNCDFPTWNPNTEMLMFVTAGQGGLAGTGNGVYVQNNGQFQGGLFANYAIYFSQNAHADGPLVGSTVIFENNVTAYTFPTITNVPVGMPSNPEVYAQPNPPQLYSG